MLYCIKTYIAAESDGSGLIEVLATLGSIILLIVTLHIAVFFSFKVERHDAYK